MKKILLALVLSSAATALPVAAGAQSSSYVEQRWQQAQDRYQHETEIYQTERQRYMAARGRRGGYDSGPRYNNALPPPTSGYGNNNGYGTNNGYGNNNGYDGRDPSATDYDASRYYRDDSRYQERRLGSDDMVYRGSDGRYYCKRSDGTTGLIIGGVAGGLLGNVIDGGRHRTGGTLIGGALGALAGKSIDQNSSDVRCR
ncbi:MAG: 17 kDa surface antigen [Alphaproteobacteria bacterium]|nr:17 kDa surface antigen [Alphaproteobacteria bacterium]